MNMYPIGTRYNTMNMYPIGTRDNNKNDGPLIILLGKTISKYFVNGIMNFFSFKKYIGDTNDKIYNTIIKSIICNLAFKLYYMFFKFSFDTFYNDKYKILDLDLGFTFNTNFMTSHIEYERYFYNYILDL